MGGGRKSRADRGAVRRRRTDHADQLALDLPDQFADRTRRLVAFRYAEETPRLQQRELDFPGRRGRSPWLSCRRADRSGPIGLGASAGIGRLRCGRGGGRPVRRTGVARGATDAAAVAVRPSHVCADRVGRSSRQHRDLRPDLRAEPVFPGDQRAQRISNRPCLRTDDGRGISGQSGCAAPDRTHRRARHNCLRRRYLCDVLRCSASSRTPAIWRFARR